MNSSNPYLPRILCLHGGGTSATIFKIQCVRLTRILNTSFDFVFLDAPYPADAGPGVVPFFQEMGPFWRWRSPTGPGQPVRDVLDRVLSTPGPPFVGLMGFSQGSAMAMGLLWEQEHGGKEGWKCKAEFQFAVLCMGSFPFLKIGTGEVEMARSRQDEWHEEFRGCVKTPTVHVHGLQDWVLPSSRLLLQCCEPGTATLLEYDVEHRLPITLEDNDSLKKAIVDVYEGSERMDVSGKEVDGWVALGEKLGAEEAEN